MCQNKNCGCNNPKYPFICTNTDPIPGCEDRNLTASNTTEPDGSENISIITPEVNQISAYKEHLEFVNSTEPLSGIKKHTVIRLAQTFLTYVANIFKGRNVGVGSEVYKGSEVSGGNTFQSFRRLRSTKPSEIAVVQSENNIDFTLGKFGKNIVLENTTIKLLDQDDNVLAVRELNIENINDLESTLNLIQLDFKGVLKVGDPKPTVVGKYDLIDVGTYTNLVPNIKIGETTPSNTPIVTEDEFYNAVYFDGTNFIQIRTTLAIPLDTEGGALSYERGHYIDLILNGGLIEFNRTDFLDLPAGPQLANYIKNIKIPTNGKLTKLIIPILSSNTTPTVKVIVFSKDGLNFTQVSSQTVTVVNNTINELALNLDVKQGQYVGIQADNLKFTYENTVDSNDYFLLVANPNGTYTQSNFRVGFGFEIDALPLIQEFNRVDSFVNDVLDPKITRIDTDVSGGEIEYGEKGILDISSNYDSFYIKNQVLPKGTLTNFYVYIDTGNVATTLDIVTYSRDGLLFTQKRIQKVNVYLGLNDVSVNIPIDEGDYVGMSTNSNSFKYNSTIELEDFSKLPGVGATGEYAQNNFNIGFGFKLDKDGLADKVDDINGLLEGDTLVLGDAEIMPRVAGTGLISNYVKNIPFPDSGTITKLFLPLDSTNTATTVDVIILSKNGSLFTLQQRKTLNITGTGLNTLDVNLDVKKDQYLGIFSNNIKFTYKDISYEEDYFLDGTNATGVYTQSAFLLGFGFEIETTGLLNQDIFNVDLKRQNGANIIINQPNYKYPFHTRIPLGLEVMGGLDVTQTLEGLLVSNTDYATNLKYIRSKELILDYREYSISSNFKLKATNSSIVVGTTGMLSNGSSENVNYMIEAEVFFSTNSTGFNIKREGNNIVSSTVSLPADIGDRCVVSVTHYYDRFIAIFRNKTKRTQDILMFTLNTSGAVLGQLPPLHAYPKVSVKLGQVAIEDFKIDLLDVPKTLRTLVIGDSISTCSFSNGYKNAWQHQAFTKNNFTTVSGPGYRVTDSIRNINSIGILNPQYCLIYMGTNECLGSVPTTDFKNNLTTLISYCKDRSITPILMTIALLPGLDIAPYVQATKEVGIENNVKVVDISTILSNSDIYTDNVHPVPSGHAKIAAKVVADAPELFQ